MNSIRGRLLVWQISALLLTAILASLITYLLAWDAFNRIRDYGLEQIAYSVVRHGVEYENDEEVRNDHGQFVSQIWAVDGSLFYSSIGDKGPPRQPPGLHVVNWDNTQWRVYSLVEGGLTIQVSSSMANRTRRFAQIAPWLLLPLVSLVVILGLVIRTAVGRALAPLDQVRAEIGKRGALSLQPLDNHGLPEEVAPLVNTLNDLLGRLDRTMTAQREFIADAAHELRTPLTAVKLQAQIAQRATGAEERDGALSQLAQGVDRAGHLVDQLLGMARVEPEARRGAFQPVALDALIKQAVAAFSAQADARDIDLGVGACAPLTVNGHAESLRIMLGNLIDNALRYSPAGGQIDVELQFLAGTARLTVRDSGPGIPAGERERVFERFHRLAGADIPGSGLGLAIVRQVVVLHGGTIRLDDADAGGLLVEVALPQARSHAAPVQLENRMQ